MKREFDWTQEFQETMDGRKVRVLCRDAKGVRPVVGLITFSDSGNEETASWTYDGFVFCGGHTSKYDLRPLPPKKHVRWVNFDADGSYCVCASKEEADRRAAPNRISCVSVEYAEGQFDD